MPEIASTPFNPLASSVKINRPVEEQQSLQEIQQQERKGPKFVSAKDHNQLKKDDFLKLLTHQLANQDPLKPMDQKEFSADLAQFSQLEQLSNISKFMEIMADSSQANKKLMGASFLGKKISTLGNKIDLKEDPVELGFNLEKPASKILVRILDGKGQIVEQKELEESFSRGFSKITWDGKDSMKMKAPKGHYIFEVLAWDESGMPFTGMTSAQGIVTSTFFEKDGTPILEIDHKKRIFLEEIQTISQESPKQEQIQTPTQTQAKQNNSISLEKEKE